MPTIYSYGGLVIEVAPFAVDALTFEATAEYAPKDIMGAPRSREFVGLGDERIGFTGKLFPEVIASLGAAARTRAAGAVGGAGGAVSKFDGGGLKQLDLLDQIRRGATAHLLIRGDGKNLGWYFLEGVTQNHTRLRTDGIPKQLEFAFSLVRSPAPRAADYVRSLLRLFA